MYFLSSLDPNYRIKGSRDPLGLQSLWAAAGHKAVKHLSTVSSKIEDFMILCYGFYFYDKRDPRGFIKFFIKFEQVFAYARYMHNHEKGFNGVDFISKKESENVFNISLTDTILSNQRAYGIYGKYIRPLRDMGIIEDPNFKSIMESSLSKTDRTAIFKIINPLFDINIIKSRIKRDDLIPIAQMLKNLTSDEQNLYREYILKVPGAEHPQNNLYEVIKHNKQITNATFQLHQIIQALLNTKEINESLKDVLINIDNTDKVLHPLNKVFTHLLSKSLWSEDEIKKEQLFEKLPGVVNYDFTDETVRKLNKALGMPVLDMIRMIINRNEEVSKLRGNKSWIEEDKKIFRILYGENGEKVPEINNDTDYEFPYFLNNYIGLFKQIEKS